MDKSLNFDNKEYISAKNAAKIFGYSSDSSDYIGQLCRSKKIKAKLIGRSWYVCLEDLENHKNTKHSKNIFSKKAKNIKHANIFVQNTFENDKYDLKINKNLIDKKSINKNILSEEKSRLNDRESKNILYFKDESPLFPSIIKNNDSLSIKNRVLFYTNRSISLLKSYKSQSEFVFLNHLKNAILGVVGIALIISSIKYSDKEHSNRTLSIKDSLKSEYLFVLKPVSENSKNIFSGFTSSINKNNNFISQNYLASVSISKTTENIFDWMSGFGKKIIKPWIEENNNFIVDAKNTNSEIYSRNNSNKNLNENIENKNNTTKSQSKIVYLPVQNIFDKDFIDKRISERLEDFKKYFVSSPTAPNVNRYYVTRQNDNIINNIGNNIENINGSTITNSTFSGTSTLNFLSVTGSTTVKDLTATEWLAVGTTTNRETLTLDGAFYLASRSVPTDTANKIYNANGGDLYWNGSIIAGATVGNWTTDGTSVWRAGGNVGIGTSTPATKFHINGSSPEFRISNDGYGLTNYGRLRLDASHNVYLDTVQADLYVGTFNTGNNLYLRAGSQNVGTVKYSSSGGLFGIASTTPGFALSVTGSGFFDGGNVTASTFTATSSISTPSLTLSSLTNSLLSTNSSGQIIASTTPTVNNIWATSTSLTNYFAGNVGIGTTAPGVKLDVDGHIRILDSAGATPSLYFGAIGVLTKEVSTGDIYHGSSANSIHQFGHNKYYDIQAYNGSGYVSRFRIDSTGNVGIGSTTPGYKLSVAGSGYFDGGNVTASTFTATSSISTPSLSLSSLTNSLLSTNSSGQIVASTTPTVNNIWATSTILANYFGGNVGVGTASPGYPLDVAGIIQSRGASGLGGYLSLGNLDNTGYSSITNDASSGNNELALITGGSTRIKILQGGNVGIGSTTPGYKLSVAGSGYFDGGNVTASTFTATSSISTPSLTLSSVAINSLLSTNSSGVITATSTPTFGNFNATSTTATSTLAGGLAIETSGLVYDYSTNNVGIGTASPASKLQVAGTVSLTNGSDKYGFGSDPVNYYIGGSIDTTSGIPLHSFYGWTMRGGSGVGLRVDASSNVGIGTTTPWGSLAVNNIAGQPGFVVGSSTATSFVVDKNGNVGVGRAIPDYKFEVYGNSARRFSVGNDGVARWNEDGRGGLLTWDSDRAIINTHSGTENLAFNVESSEKMRITTAGLVGIGTASPAGNLHISSGAPFFKLEATTGTNYVQQDFTNTSGSLRLGLENSSGGGLLTGTSAYAGIFGHTGAYPLQFSTNNNVRMTINSSGNVGIGTTSPNAKLNVEGGNLLVNSNVVSVAPGGGLRIVAPIASTHYNWMLGAQQNVSATFEITPSTAVGGTTFSTPTAVFTAGGNVGIGTASPSAKLSIAGSTNNIHLGEWVTSTAYNALYLNASPSTSGSYTLLANDSGSVFLNANGSGDIKFREDNNDLMTLTNAGRLGIGVTAPASQLELYQTANISPQLRIGNNHFNRGIDFGYTTNTAFIQGKADIATTPINYTLALNPNGANVGVGDDSPDAKLDILQGSDAEAQGLQISRANDSDYTRIYKTPSLGSLNDPLVFSSNFVADHAAIGRDGSAYFAGSVGIGTSTPLSKLSIVSGDVAEPTLGQSNSAVAILGSNAHYGLFIGQNGGTGASWIQSMRNDSATAYALNLQPSGGNVGIATTSPWRTLSVTGTVGFDGLTGSTGAGSLCLDSNKQVVYNSASDSCLPSLRDTKNSITDLSVNAMEVLENLDPVSFVYNQGDGRTRYGFIAEDTANVNEFLATYNAEGEISGVDDRAILSVLVQGFKNLLSAIKITEDNKIGFGTTTPSAKLAITQDANNETGGLWIAEEGNTDYRSIYMDTDGNLHFQGGDTSGMLNDATLNSAGEWTNSSDRNYKENIEDIEYGLEDIMKLNPRSYKIKNTNNTRIGFIAQEVELVIPEVVSGVEGRKSVSYGNLVAVAIKGVQDLNKDVSATTTIENGKITLMGRIVNFFKDRGVIIEETFTKITRLFVGSLYVENELCVDDTCINKDQLKALILQSGVGSTQYNNIPSSNTSPNTDGTSGGGDTTQNLNTNPNENISPDSSSDTNSNPDINTGDVSNSVSTENIVAQNNTENTTASENNLTENSNSVPSLNVQP